MMLSWLRAAAIPMRKSYMVAPQYLQPVTCSVLQPTPRISVLGTAFDFGLGNATRAFACGGTCGGGGSGKPTPKPAPSKKEAKKDSKSSGGKKSSTGKKKKPCPKKEIKVEKTEVKKKCEKKKWTPKCR